MYKNLRFTASLMLLQKVVAVLRGIVIVGAGAAGTTVAIEARKVDRVSGVHSHLPLGVWNANLKAQ